MELQQCVQVRSKGGAMTRPKENELVLEEKNGTVHLTLRVTLRRQTLEAFFLLFLFVFFAVESCLDEDTRKLIRDVLLSLLQASVFVGRSLKL
jgi:hypothetical protein